MLSRWTQHLTDSEEKERFKREIINAGRVLDRLCTIAEEDEAALDKAEFDQRSYGIANWSYLQAHRNGNRQVYAELKKYLRPERKN